MPRVAALLLASVATTVVALVAAVALLDRDDDSASSAGARAAEAIAPAVQIARGAYLVRAGNCLGCHTETGGEPFAGGVDIETPFGTVRAPNLTPDPQGLGAWSADDFWRALHDGRSRDGRRLYPVFPYPNYTRLERADADAMYAYLKTVAPVARANQPHALRFPFDQQAALRVWRALFFRPGRFQPDAAHSPQWNRGAYLVETLGHCNACHSQRNAFGASSSTLDLAGGLIPIQNWYAPSLFDDAQAGVSDWPAQDVVALLKTGVSPRGSAQGPMARVVVGSTQYLDDGDLAAMTAYLRDLPGRRSGIALAAPAAPTPVALNERGRKLYSDRCAACHGDSGEGVAGAYPPLAGNRAIALDPPANLVHMVLRGGFAPATAGHARPFGMPPFATVLSDDEVADVLSYIRAAWQPRAAPVSALEVRRFRGAAQ